MNLLFYFVALPGKMVMGGSSSFTYYTNVTEEDRTLGVDTEGFFEVDFR